MQIAEFIAKPLLHRMVALSRYGTFLMRVNYLLTSYQLWAWGKCYVVVAVDSNGHVKSTDVICELDDPRLSLFLDNINFSTI